jgi:hypothetical protein
MLYRTKLRQLIIQLLKGNTLAGDQVFDSRLVAWDENKLPAISVSTSSQNGNALHASQIPSFETIVTIQIEAVIAANTKDWAERLDNLCEQIEDALFRNVNFTSNEQIKYSYIQNYNTNMKYYDGGEYPIASSEMELVFSINRIFFEPIVKDEFDTLGVESKNINAEINLNTLCECPEKIK